MTRQTLTTLLTVMIVLASATGCSHVIRAYDGDKRPDAEVAQVFNTEEIRLVRVDERPIDDFVWSFRGENEPEKHRFDLLPGEHRIAVKYYRTIADTAYTRQWQESVNNATLRYTFEAGKSYSFIVHTVTGPGDRRPRPNQPVPAGLWRPMLIDKASGAIVAQPEEGPLANPMTSSPPATVTPQPYVAATAAPPPPPPPAGLVSGMCTVTGVAQVRTKKLGLITCAGREVLLVPHSPRVDKWVREELKYRKPGAKWPFPPNTPDEAEDDDKVRKAIGYGDGQFVFERVPLGEYLLVFEGDEPEVFVTAPVSVHPGRARIDNVRPTPPTMHQ